MPRGGKRKGAGRKPSPYTMRKELRLRPEHYDWLDNQPGTPKEIIDKLITEAIDIQNNIA